MRRFYAQFPALASPEFRIFWVGQFVSLVGTWMQNTVQPYLAYRLTGQPVYLGLVGFAATLPTLLFTLPGGVLVERLDKRRVVIALQAIMLLQAFALAFLSLTGRIHIWHIVALSFVLGSANAIEITARQAMMIELVGKEALPNAIALNSTAFNTARVLGPSLAAPFLLFLQTNGEGWAFFANGISYAFVIVGLLFISRQPHPKRQARRQSALDEFRDGLRYIRRTPVVAMLISMAAILGFFAIPVGQQIPVLARDVLGQAGEAQAAVAARNSALVTAQGVGALLAAILLAALSTRTKQKGRLLMIGQLAFGVAFLSLGLIRSLPAALALIAVFGWGVVTQLATTNTLIQLLVPDDLRGRVISTYLWGLQGVAPFGSLLVGWAVQEWGLATAVFISGSICLGSAVLIHFTTPALRRTVA
jgi:MFS family permease